MELNNRGWELCISEENLIFKKGLRILGVEVAIEYIRLFLSIEVMMGVSEV